jgi:hypothetical protein
MSLAGRKLQPNSGTDPRFFGWRNGFESGYDEPLLPGMTVAVVTMPVSITISITMTIVTVAVPMIVVIVVMIMIVIMVMIVVVRRFGRRHVAVVLGGTDDGRRLAIVSIAADSFHIPG